MKPYLNAILDYVPVVIGAAAGGAMLAFGVGHELSDLLRVETDLPRMAIDTAVGVSPIFAAGGIVEGAKALCNFKVESKLPGDYQQ